MDENEMTKTPDEAPKVQVQRGSTHIYAYTALIFIVAILMILLAFFGQTNLKKQENIDIEGKSITEKSAAISNENLHLRDRVADLDEQLEQKNVELGVQQNVNDAYSKIFSVSVLIDVNNLVEAKRVFVTIDETLLSGDSKVIYDKQKEKLAAVKLPE